MADDPLTLATPIASVPAEHEIVYVGPKLDNGRIDLKLLSEALGGFATLTERSSAILYGQLYDHNAEFIASPRTGSVIIPVDFVSHGVRVVENGLQEMERYLLTPAAQAVANLVTLLGVGPVAMAVGLFRMFKTKKGRVIDPVADPPPMRDTIINIEINRYIRLYNDKEIRASIRKTLRPLREDGITEFQTRHRGVVIERVTKADLLEADAAELADLVEFEERWLDIQKVALLRHLAWHFAGEGQTFDAKIEYDRFLEQIND